MLGRTPGHLTLQNTNELSSTLCIRGRLFNSPAPSPYRTLCAVYFSALLLTPCPLPSATLSLSHYSITHPACTHTYIHYCTRSVYRFFLFVCHCSQLLPSLSLFTYSHFESRYIAKQNETHCNRGRLGGATVPTIAFVV